MVFFFFKWVLVKKNRRLSLHPWKNMKKKRAYTIACILLRRNWTTKCNFYADFKCNQASGAYFLGSFIGWHPVVFKSIGTTFRFLETLTSRWNNCSLGSGKALVCCRKSGVCDTTQDRSTGWRRTTHDTEVEIYHLSWSLPRVAAILASFHCGECLPCHERRQATHVKPSSSAGHPSELSTNCRGQSTCALLTYSIPLKEESKRPLQF